jgi:hypothetical protein
VKDHKFELVEKKIRFRRQADDEAKILKYQKCRHCGQFVFTEQDLSTLEGKAIIRSAGLDECDTAIIENVMQE